MSRAHFSGSVAQLIAGHTDNALAGVVNPTIEVRQVGTSTKISETIYATRTGGAVLANPFTGDTHGEYDFWLAQRDQVDLYITGPGLTPVTRTVNVDAAADELKVQLAATATNLDATPSVAGISLLIVSNTGATSVTNFDDGAEAQELEVLFTTANTTVVHDATKIVMRGATTLTFLAGESAHFVCRSAVWYEVAGPARAGL